MEAGRGNDYYYCCASAIMWKGKTSSYKYLGIWHLQGNMPCSTVSLIYMACTWQLLLWASDRSATRTHLCDRTYYRP